MRASRRLLRHGAALTRLSALVLLAAGGIYVLQGVIWSWRHA
jgi:cytochrome c-type biogenesis protein